METLLTILMFLGIYVVFPLLVATLVCGIALLGKRRVTRAERAGQSTTTAAAREEGVVHQSVKF